MTTPRYVRALSDDERDALKPGLRSSDAFILRRSQILLASARRERSPASAEQLGCASQTVCNTIRAFNERGLATFVTDHYAFQPPGRPSCRVMLLWCLAGV
jgi:hypothetical protein